MSGVKKPDAKVQTPSCGVCFFAASQPVIDSTGKVQIGKFQLICKHGPPSVVALTLPTAQGVAEQLASTFPAVTVDMWCHQFMGDYEDADFSEYEKAAN